MNCAGDLEIVDPATDAADAGDAKIDDMLVVANSEGLCLVAVASAEACRVASGSASFAVRLVAAEGLGLVLVVVDEASEAPLPRIRA